MAFRVVQARTGALVAGYDAWRFFDRSTSGSKAYLEIFVAGAGPTLELCQWLEENGYRFSVLDEQKAAMPHRDDEDVGHFDAEYFSQ